jgi:arylsulfatase A-like enzyme
LKDLAVRAPNIVFILIDDLGCRDLGSFGSTFHETPRLDRLAAEGLRFDRAYAAAPVCSPTRASILSGKYPARVGITQWIGGTHEGKVRDVPYLHYLPLEETSLATALREGGYQTWHVGKWHLGDEAFLPGNHGFDVNIGGSHHGHPPAGFFAPYEPLPLPDAPPGEYLTDRLTDEAIRLIRGRQDRPFFLHLSHYAVHEPIQAPAALVRKYQRKAAALGLDQIAPFTEGESFTPLALCDRRVQRRLLQSDPAYAAMIENLDWNVGRILDALEAEGLAGETLVVFTSDNGGLSTGFRPPTCNLPALEGKGWNFEGGTRVAQLARWPGVIAPRSSASVPVTSTDFYPTFLEAAGLPARPGQHCDGVSLLPLFRGRAELPRDAIFWHYPHYSNQGGTPAASMVEGEWKLIEFFEEGRLALFHLASDPSEQRDLADAEPARLARMAARLRAWQAEVEALIPAPNPDYAARAVRPKVPDNAHV